MSNNNSEPPSSSGEHATLPDHSAATPKDLKVQLKDQRLRVEWSDGQISQYTFNDLRRHCPCATCRSEKEEANANPLKILKFDPSTIKVTDARLVGNYAIQFFWSDGHNTGIFDYRYLRKLDTGLTP